MSWDCKSINCSLTAWLKALLLFSKHILCTMAKYSYCWVGAEVESMDTVLESTVALVASEEAGREDAGVGICCCAMDSGIDALGGLEGVSSVWGCELPALSCEDA